jgi:hypothetical protein
VSWLIATQRERRAKACRVRARVASLAATGLASSAIITPLAHTLLDRPTHSIGLVAGFIMFAPIEVIEGYVLGWAASLFFERERDVGVMPGVLVVVYSVAIVVLPPLLNR